MFSWSLRKCSDFDLLSFYKGLGRKIFTQISLRMVLFSVLVKVKWQKKICQFFWFIWPLSFAVDLLKFSYCKMCLIISIFYTVLPKFFICFNFDSCWRKFEMIESKFPLSGQLDMNKNKRKATVTINLANVQTYASPTPCPVKKKKV